MENKFILQSPFQPAGDQPEAILALTKNLKSGAKDQTLWGVTGSGKTFTMANVIADAQKPTLVIAHNKTLAAQLADEFRQFFPENAVHYFVSYYDYYQPEAYIPSSDTYIEKDSSINDEIDRLRHAATYALLTRKDVIIVASVSCIYGIGSPAMYAAQNLVLSKGESIPRNKILEKLTNMRYDRNDYDAKRGTFRLSGETLEIFPAYSQNAIKVTFFGDQIEKISEIDWITGTILRNLDFYEVFPASHFVTNPEENKAVTEQIRKDLDITIAKFKAEGKILQAERIKERTSQDIEMIEQTGTCAGIENYSRYFDGRSAGEPATTLIDYFPKDFLMFIDESHMTIPQIGAMFFGDLSRKQKLVDYGFRLPAAYDNRPLKFAEFVEKQNQTIYVSATPADYEKDLSKDKIVSQFIRPTGLLDPSIEVRSAKGQVENLITEIEKTICKNQRVLVTTLTKKMAEELTDFMKDRGLKVAYLHSDVKTFERVKILHSLRLGNFDILVGINLLREGLDLPEVSLIAILDADKEGFLRSKTSLIQTIGRAARHQEGKVIMYADVITKSMKAAIDETESRRKIQDRYNKENNITPTSTVRTLNPEEIEAESQMLEIDELYHKLPKKEKKKVIADMREEMEKMAAELQFERSAELRDQILELERKF
ncbi:MAG: excinuclease ABC subunit UvrB [Candidatus Berkelbacteria bacterium]